MISSRSTEAAARRARREVRLWALLSLLVAVLVAEPSQATSRDKARHNLERAALRAYQAGDFKLAAQVCHHIFERDPKVVGALFNAARAEQRGKMYGEAEYDYQTFLDQAPASNPSRRAAKRFLAEVREAMRQAASVKPAASAPVTTRPAMARPAVTARPAAQTAMASKSVASPTRPPATTSALKLAPRPQTVARGSLVRVVPPPASPPAATPFYRRWWFLTAAGAVVVAGAAVAVAESSGTQNVTQHPTVDGQVNVP